MQKVQKREVYESNAKPKDQLHKRSLIGPLRILYPVS